MPKTDNRGRPGSRGTAECRTVIQLRDRLVHVGRERQGIPDNGSVAQVAALIVYPEKRRYRHYSPHRPSNFENPLATVSKYITRR